MIFVTAKKGKNHVTSQQFRGIVAAMAGTESYIADMDEHLEPELAVNNTIKIRSGTLIHHGGVMVVKSGTYDEVTYQNGTQAMKRIDLVVARYTQDTATETENAEWVVIQGQPAESNPVAPDYIHGNMQDGDLADDCPIFELHFDGINVTEVRKLINIMQSVDELNRKLAYVKTDISQNLKVYREGRRVTVQGLVLINGTSMSFELPYTATDVTRFPTIGLSNSLALAGYSFGTVKGAVCEITFGNAITYAAVNFAYYTNL
jgi:hypothetical protein